MEKWLTKTGLEEEKVFTSCFSYSDNIPLNEKARNTLPGETDAILLVAGIAWPDSLLQELQLGSNTRIMLFRDHHSYTDKDVRAIISAFKLLPGTNKILVTTGKDAVKLKYFPELQQIPMFCIDRHVIMGSEQKKELIERILKNG